MKNFVILNRYPYTSGHVMIVPTRTPRILPDSTRDTAAEMMLLAQRVQAALDDVYHPDGFNLGMNLGRSAGAGIADHLHMHLAAALDRRHNFMTTVGETRLEPEELSDDVHEAAQALARVTRCLQRAS